VDVLSDHELEALIHAVVVLVIALAAYVNAREHRKTRREANGQSTTTETRE
jgi:hypothetical protein